MTPGAAQPSIAGGPARARGSRSAEMVGRLVIWPGRALYLGGMLENEAHAHHAIQLSVALDGPPLLQAASDQRWSSYRAVVTAANQPHRLRCGGPVAQIYVDPESGAGIALRQWLGGAGIRSIERGDFDIEALSAALHAYRDEHVDHRQVVRAIDRILDSAGPHSRRAEIDPRVQKTLTTIQELHGQRPSLTAVAERVGLSPGRLGWLFRRDLGVTFRRYLLWLRLVNAIQELSNRASLTEAAHTAGFADSAHFSRTFRRMFGMSPSALTAKHVTIHDVAAGSPAAPS